LRKYLIKANVAVLALVPWLNGFQRRGFAEGIRSAVDVSRIVPRLLVERSVVASVFTPCDNHEKRQAVQTK